MSLAMSAEPQFPSSIVPLIRWGEDNGMLPEAFSAGREMLEQRTHMRAMLLQSILPPILFVMIGCSVLFVVGALFVPFGSMIQGLS